MSMRGMNPKTKKAYEEEEKRYEEDKAAAIRILGFIYEDEEMRRMPQTRIKGILEQASDIISAFVNCITLEQLCAQAARVSDPEQPACQESHPAS